MTSPHHQVGRHWYTFLFLWVVWTFDASYRDVLERSRDLVHWEDVPGPYALSLPGDEYRVSVPAATWFYRIHREHGNPWQAKPAP